MPFHTQRLVGELAVDRVGHRLAEAHVGGDAWRWLNHSACGAKNSTLVGDAAFLVLARRATSKFSTEPPGRISILPVEGDQAGGGVGITCQ